MPVAGALFSITVLTALDEQSLDASLWVGVPYGPLGSFPVERSQSPCPGDSNLIRQWWDSAVVVSLLLTYFI